jgi:hypothetical protein
MFNAYNHPLASYYLRLHVELCGFAPRSGWLYQFGDENAFISAVEELEVALELKEEV